MNLWAIFIPIIYYLSPQQSGRLLLLVVALVVVIIDFFRLHINGIKEGFILFFGSFLRRHELTRLSGATYLLLGCLITSFLFSKPVVIAACSFIIVGDTFAALFGQSIKGPKLFRKTLMGSIGFLTATVAVSFILFPLLSAPLLNLLIGAVAATVFEALPLPWDDNFSVPIFTGVVMSLI